MNPDRAESFDVLEKYRFTSIEQEYQHFTLYFYTTAAGRLPRMKAVANKLEPFSAV